MDWDAYTKKGGSGPRIAMKKKLLTRGKWNKHAKLIEYTPLKWLRNVFLPMGGNFQWRKTIWVRRMESGIQSISETNLHWKLETQLRTKCKFRISGSLFFFLVIHEGETLAEVKVRIQKKLLVPEEEFAKWRFAFFFFPRSSRVPSRFWHCLQSFLEKRCLWYLGAVSRTRAFWHYS